MEEYKLRPVWWLVMLVLLAWGTMAVFVTLIELFPTNTVQAAEVTTPLERKYNHYLRITKDSQAAALLIVAEKECACSVRPD